MKTMRDINEDHDRRAGLMHPRRVLIVTYDFPPAIVVGAQAGAQIARYLPAYGWEPIVLTVHERHITLVDTSDRGTSPGTVVRTGVLPHPFTLYRFLKRVMTAEHTSAAATAPARRSPFRRWILSLLMIPDECNGWIFPAILRGLVVIRARRPHCIFSTGPRWTNHVVGLALAKLTALPWVAQFRDPWDDGEDAKPISSISVRTDRALRNWTMRTAQTITCVTEEHTRLLRAAHPEIPPAKIITIPNGYDGAEWEPVSTDGDGASPATADKFVITYAGSLYHLRNPLPLFRALRSLIDSGRIAAERIQVDLIGECEMAEEVSVAKMAAGYGLRGCVNKTGVLSREETLRRVARSNLLLLLAESSVHQIPGKTYEYLKAGRPILALASSGAVMDLLRRTGGAWIVSPADERGLATALLEAYRGWSDGTGGPRPDPLVVAGFDRRLLAGRFAAVFDASVFSVPLTHLNRWPGRAARLLSIRANTRRKERARKTP